MTDFVIQGTEPVIKVNSLGIGIDNENDDYTKIINLNLSDTEYLVVGDGKGSANNATNNQEVIRNMYVNSRGVSINTSRDIYNKSDANTSLYVSKNIHCDGIIRANGIQFSNITIEGELTSNLISDLINAVENHKKTHPFKSGYALYKNDINDIQYPINNVYTEDNITLGSYIDTFYNKHALNINTATNNDFDSIQLAIRNDTKLPGTNIIDPNLSKLSIGIIGANSLSPAVISTTKGMPLEFHISKTSTEMNLLYDNKKRSLPTYSNNSNYAAMTIDSDANVYIGIDKSEPIHYFKKKSVNGIYSNDLEQIVKNPRLVVNGASKFDEVIIYDNFKKQYDNIDNLYIRAEGLTDLDPSIIRRGTFNGDKYIFKKDVNVDNLLTSSNINSVILDSTNIIAENITINAEANFRGVVNFDNENLLEINKLKISNFLEIDGFRINPDKNGGSNFFYTNHYPDLVNVDTNKNISFPNKLSIGPNEGDFPGVVNIYKNNTPDKDFVVQNKKFEIILQDNTKPDTFIANIGRLSYLDPYDNSLIINTNEVNGIENNIYFYPSVDITKLKNNAFLPNLTTNPPMLSITNKGVGINIKIPRQDLHLDIMGKISATEYYITKYDIVSKISSFIYNSSKNYFNIFNEDTYKYCINYDSSTSLSSKMKGLNVKQGINADLYYQNDLLIETLRTTKNFDGFYTNEKIAIGWYEEDLKVPLQIRNQSRDDYNYSIIRIYRGYKGGGVDNNGSFSGIDICEYDKDKGDDRNLEKWFIYRNHEYDKPKYNEIGPLQFGYTDKTIKPTTYGMSMYYNTFNSNYHIEFNNPKVSSTFAKGSSISAVSIYGDLDVYGNINIIDNNSNNFNFRLKKLEKLSNLEYYVNIVSTSNIIYKNIIDYDDVEYSGKNIILKPVETTIIDSSANNNIPFVVKQNNDSFSTAKFITYSNDNSITSTKNSSIELGIYKNNEFTTAYDANKDANLNNMIKINVSNDIANVNNTNLTFSSYYKNTSKYEEFLVLNNNPFSSQTYMRLGQGEQKYDSNITLHIDDNNKCGIQINNIDNPVKINMVNTSGSYNKYTILSSGNNINNYKFTIDVADIPNSINQLESGDIYNKNVFTIAPYNENNNLRKGSRYGFNEINPTQTVVINSEYDQKPILITHRYTEYKFFTSVETNTSNINLAYNINSNWNNIEKKYKSTDYKYTVPINSIKNIDFNGDIIDAKKIYYKDNNLVTNISYKSIYSNIDISYKFNNKTTKISPNNNQYNSVSTRLDTEVPTPDFLVKFDVSPNNYLFDIEPSLNYGNNEIIYKGGKKIVNYESSNVFSITQLVSNNNTITFNIICVFDNVYNIPTNLIKNNFNISNIIETSNSYISDVQDKIDINLVNNIYTYFPGTNIDNYTGSHIFVNTCNQLLGIYNPPAPNDPFGINLVTTTSNIFRYNSAVPNIGKFDIERTNNISINSCNIFPSTKSKKSNSDDYITNSNVINFNYNILEYNNDDTKNIIDLTIKNEIIDDSYDTELKYLSSTNLLDTFTIINDETIDGIIINNENTYNFSNIITLNEYYRSYVNNSNINIQVNKINLQGVNPHITLANYVENQTISNDIQNEIYSYDGNFKISFNDSLYTTDQLLIKKNGDAIFYGNIYTSNDLYIDGKIFSDGTNIIDTLTDSVHKISSNITNSHKEYLYNIFDLRISTDIMNTSNYVVSTSNIISKRIENLTTDMINNTEGSRNKFIVDNIYNDDILVIGDLTVRNNLIVEGGTTTLDTIIYATERLEIINDNESSPALIIQQKVNTPNITPNILEAKNKNGANVFTISYNGDVNIDGNYKIKNRDVIFDTSNYVLATCNILVEKIENYDINISNYILSTSNYYGNLINAKSPWNVTNSNIYYTSNVKITGQLYIDGDLTVSGYVLAGQFTDGTTIPFSDNRLKDQTSNIRNPIDLISKLNGFYYKPNDLAEEYGFKKRDEIGLSAQEVQNILPEIVSLAPFDMVRDSYNNIVSKSGNNYLTINYEKLAPLFVESIKDLKKELNELKLELAELRNNKNK
jgi:hypothetical protein